MGELQRQQRRHSVIGATIQVTAFRAAVADARWNANTDFRPVFAFVGPLLPSSFTLSRNGP